MSKASSSQIDSKYIRSILEHDVLLGRGSGPNEHPGNIRYRSLCLQRKEEYTKTSLRNEKNEIAKWVFGQVDENGGRFVKQVEAGSSIPGDDALYMEVEKEVALEKIRQSLRQTLNRPKNLSPRNSPTNGTSKGAASRTGVSLPNIARLRSSSSSSRSKLDKSPSKISGSAAKATNIRSPTDPNDLQRYKLILSYDGTRYKGWQRQSSSSTVQDGFTSPSPKNTHHLKKRKHDDMGRVVTIPLTIQETLEDALEMYSSLDRPTLKVRMAGRTDAGVHARGQVVAVTLPKPKSKASTSPDTELWQIRKSINSRLPRDLSVDAISMCDASFDPRQDVVLKQYSYTLRYFRRSLDDRGSTVLPICFKGGPELLRSAFDNDRCWLVPWALDDTKLDQYCKLLVGDHDFSAFVHKRVREDRDNCKKVTRFECIRVRTTLQEDGASICEARFEVEAQGFGRSQVRNFIGFIVDLCRGVIQDYDTVERWLWKSPPENISKVINAAPACGLCLEWVKYAEMEKNRNT
ncbi:tRNA pseudouridine synthase A [Nitzschia inconspicua]|uniref:tRNA pseudouridine synthase A n=1 Tax=Nitzschia inconspicua TaxID=303405 RepID=A0A9K3LWJ7_9STRA|nr:tRNA pseudouridine synthase A [Nitzschia inconspicua]